MVSSGKPGCLSSLCPLAGATVARREIQGIRATGHQKSLLSISPRACGVGQASDIACVRTRVGQRSADLGYRATAISYVRQVRSAQSFDEFAADYDRFASLEAPTLRDWLLRQLPAHRERALDAGCGSGRHALALADRFDQIIGVDISQPLIEIARRKRCPPNIDYRVQDLLSVQDPGGFDLVFSSTTLHHLLDLAAPLRHLRGLLKPGGTIVLIDNVASQPTPARWVHVLGAVRGFPGDLRRLGWERARWQLEFRTSRAWLNHLAIDRYLTRQEFDRRYGAVFPGARFQQLGYAQGLVWQNPV